MGKRTESHRKEGWANTRVGTGVMEQQAKQSQELWEVARSREGFSSRAFSRILALVTS
jgi:hypothetical protein